MLQGLIFAVATNNGLIRLYDSKNYQAGPFSTFLVSTATSRSCFTLPGYANTHIHYAGLVSFTDSRLGLYAQPALHHTLENKTYSAHQLRWPDSAAAD